MTDQHWRLSKRVVLWEHVYSRLKRAYNRIFVDKVRKLCEGRWIRARGACLVADKGCVKAPTRVISLIGSSLAVVQAGHTRAMDWINLVGKNSFHWSYAAIRRPRTSCMIRLSNDLSRQIEFIGSTKKIHRAFTRKVSAFSTLKGFYGWAYLKSLSHKTQRAITCPQRVNKQGNNWFLWESSGSFDVATNHVHPDKSSLLGNVLSVGIMSVAFSVFPKCTLFHWTFSSSVYI